MKARPRVVLIGGPDVDARLALMDRLAESYDVSAMGSDERVAAAFAARGFGFDSYPLVRSVNPLADLRCVRRLAAQLRRLAPDVVHSFDTKPGVYGSIAARRAGVPVVVTTVTGLGSLYSSSGVKTALLRWIYERMQRLASRRADVTVFQNHDDRTQLVGAGVVPAGRAEVILGSGVETEVYRPEAVTPERRLALRDELGLPRDATVVTMIARVTRTKGVLEFAAAAREVRASHPRARFLLVGPDDTESLDRLRDDERAMLREHVVWPGPRRDIVDVLAASDVAALPTAYREGIPRVLLEAAAMGLPIVTTDSPGCNEAVVHERNGMLVPAGDVAALTAAIARLVDDAPARARFGLVSRERAVSEFDLGVVAAQTSRLYDRLLQRAGVTAPAAAAAPPVAGSR